MVILASVSMAAYKCSFKEGFKATPEFYFFHLFYFRSRHCDSAIDWSIFGLESDEFVAEILRMPDEIAIVSRTYLLSFVQLIINSLLIVSSIVIIGERF